jgi:DNA-binding GntR family transcriptional regulator
MVKRTHGGSNNKAYECIYRSILTNKIAFGDPVSENDIARELGMSRSPVREALKRLEAEGIVTHYPNRGTFVTQMTVQDLNEIFDLRILFELYALETACTRITDNTLEKIARAIEGLDETSSPEQYYKANDGLHSTIISSCGNRRLQGFYNNLKTQISMVIRISARSPEHFVYSKKEHLNIAQAIIKRDLGKAKTLLKEHLERVRSDTITVFLHESG